MMASKRTHIEIDPDYEDVSEVQNKRRRVLEEGAKEATKKKILAIVKKQFEIEVSNKESEILNISQKLEVARSMMDRLRACIIANFYGNANQQKSSRKNAEQTPMIHPTIRKFIGKAPPGTPLQISPSEIKQEAPEGDVRTMEFVSEKIGKLPTKCQGHLKAAADKHVLEQSDSRTSRFKLKKRIIVGNVSKSIPAEQRDENDQATHKWMVYVRGPKDSPCIDDFVKKVWFFLHPSYRPNDLVEVSEAPFHLTRRGWGEFPVRVQLHFKDHRNKTRDIIHNLKLDRTYTSLQTLGCETIVDIEIEKDIPKVKREKAISTRVNHEPGTISESAANTSQRMLVPMEIKTEPADDHDYGRSACLDDAGTSSQCSVEKNIEVNNDSRISGTQLTLSHGLTSVTGSVTLARNPLQTIVSPSIIAPQPLTLIPVGPVFPQNHLNVPKLCPVTPPKNNIVQLQAVSPGVNMTVTSPPRNVVLKGFGSVSASNLGGNKAVFGSVPNSLIQISPTKSPNSKNNFMVPQPVILTNVQGNQSRLQTGLVQTSPQQSLRMNKTMNQSPNSNLIFLKCTDNRGKTYLIPQQIGTNVSSLPKGNNPGQIRVTSPVSRPILLTSSLMNSRAGVRFSGVTSSSQSPVSVASPVQKTKVNSTPPVKQPVENGPILFIKPDNNLSKRLTNAALVKSNCVAPVTSSIKMKMSSNVQVLQSVAQSQNVNVVNLKTGKQTTVCAGNQSMIRGQLKVTSQGLIQVQGQLQQQVVKGNQSHISLIEQSKISVNGGISQTSLPLPQAMQQPLILVPTSTNNKLNTLPCKGKSLLNKSISNLQVSQSNGSIVLLNQSNTVSANGNLGKILLSPGVSNHTEQGKLINAGSDHHTDLGEETKNLAAKKTQNVPANHILIVPVSSKSSVPVVTGPIGANLANISKLESAVASGKNNLSQLALETKCHEKMLILLQNDKSSKNITCENSQGQRAMFSLLGSRSNSPVQATDINVRETPVMIKSSDSREKQIIIVDKENTLENCARNLNCLGEKKIMIDPKKKRLIKPVVEVKELDIIVDLRPQDFPNLLSLIQAAVKRHPLISPTTDRHLHPYCARTSEEWLSWNVGKRRASEWQRASSTRRYLMTYLEDGRMFKGESLWTVKQILTWCRLHAYSPHYLERPLHPTAIDLQAETSLPSDKQHRNFASVTDSNSIVEEVASMQDHAIVLDSCSEDEVDIISIGSNTRAAKQRVDIPIPYHDIEMLPLSDGASYVDKMTQEIGIRLIPTVVESGYYGTVSHGILYRAMELFMGDILRNTFALKVNMGRYPDALGIADVYAALNSQPITDFLTNKFLGVEETQGVPKADR